MAKKRLDVSTHLLPCNFDDFRPTRFQPNAYWTMNSKNSYDCGKINLATSRQCSGSTTLYFSQKELAIAHELVVDRHLLSSRKVHLLERTYTQEQYICCLLIDSHFSKKSTTVSGDLKLSFTESSLQKTSPLTFPPSFEIREKSSQPPGVDLRRSDSSFQGCIRRKREFQGAPFWTCTMCRMALRAIHGLVRSASVVFVFTSCSQYF